MFSLTLYVYVVVNLRIALTASIEVWRMRYNSSDAIRSICAVGDGTYGVNCHVRGRLERPEMPSLVAGSATCRSRPPLDIVSCAGRSAKR